MFHAYNIHMARAFSFDKDEYYHIFNRGVEKRIVFSNTYEKTRFQKLLYVCNGTKVVHFSNLYDIAESHEVYAVDRGEPLVQIGAYCILSNHFHLLIKEYEIGGISMFMQKLITAYTMYFNIRNKRSGGLFEGKFRARQALDDNYLKYLFSYIHLNPAQHTDATWKTSGTKNIKRTMEYLKEYQFSSLPDYLGEARIQSIILAKDSFPNYFAGADAVKSEIFDWLLLKPETANNARFGE